jgi:hypothetical protein
MEFADIETAKDLYSYIIKRKPQNCKCYILLDEIQNVKEWERAVNSFQVDIDCDIYITGSNSQLLSSELSTLLAGRYVEFVIETLSFSEYLDFKDDEEKDIYFQTSKGATNAHNCKLYGASGDSVTSIGCWDTARGHGIWRYLSSTQNLVFDANVKVTRANGGDEFVTSDPVVHGNRSGRVHFSNGLLIQWGAESITPVANTPTAKAVTFGVSYTSVPMVVTTVISSVPGTSVLGHASANVTITGFDAYVTRTGTTNTSVGWIAIGYKA